MKFLAILALLALPAFAQEADKRLEQAKKLEAKAEKLLEQGKRAEAFDALARAAELRQKARTKKPGASAAKKKKKTRNANSAESAHADLDTALQAGNLEAARKASDKLRAARAAQTKRIAALEKQLASLEAQLAEIRRMLEIEKPG